MIPDATGFSGINPGRERILSGTNSGRDRIVPGNNTGRGRILPATNPGRDSVLMMESRPQEKKVVKKYFDEISQVLHS